jgi:hypothetical protein
MRLEQWGAAALIGALLLLTGYRVGSLPYTPGARYSDAVTSHYPAALFFYSSIREGELPLWRETIMGGQPFMANPLNKTAYPPNWISAVIPPPLSLNLLMIAHLLIAAHGMYRWTHLLRLHPLACLAGSLAYALAPRLIGHLGAGHLDIVYALAWLPWLMAAVERHFEADQARGSWLFAGMFAGLVILADVRVGLFALPLAAWYAAHLALRKKALARLPALLPALLVCAVLAVGVVIPLLIWSPHLSRVALTPEESGIFSLQPEMLLGLLLPAGANIELLTYVGLVVLGLGLFALIAQPLRHAHWLMAIALVAWYALGENGLLWRGLVELFPPLLWFRVPSRAWVIAALILPLLAAHGLDRLLAGRGAALAYPLLAFMALDLLLAGRGWLSWRSDWLTDDQRALAAALIDLSPGRIYSPTYSLEQSTAAAYGLRIFGGVDPFQLRLAAEAVQLGGGMGLQGYSVVQPPLLGAADGDPRTANRAYTPDPARLAEWGVSHVVSAYPIDHPMLRRTEDAFSGVYIYVNQALQDADIAFPARQFDRDMLNANHQGTTAAAALSGAGFLASLIGAVALRRRRSR